MSARYEIKVYFLRNVYQVNLEHELNYIVRDGRTRIISVDYSPHNTTVITEVDLGIHTNLDIGILLKEK